MKKFVKMSLVAAVTLAGLSSNVNARTLEAVAENFDVFGYVNLRYDDNSTDAEKGDNKSKFVHKLVLGATGSLTDDLSYMFAGANLDSNDTNETIYYNPGAFLVYSYFTYTGIKDTSISAGRIGLDTPLTVVYDPADSTSEANGISLSTKLGPVNIEAAYFASTNFDDGDRVRNELYDTSFSSTTDGGAEDIDGGESYVHVGLTTNLGPVALDAWYADMDDRYNVYTVGAKANFDAGDAKLTTYGRYTGADIDDTDDDQALWKVGVSAKMGIFGANLDYGETDEEGGWVTFDKDASVNLQGWKIGLMGNANTELLRGGLNVDITPNLNLSASYVDMDVDGDDQTEIYGKLAYTFKKGVTAELRLAQVDRDSFDEKEDFARAQILWHF